MQTDMGTQTGLAQTLLGTNERKGYLLIEDQETLENLELVLIWDSASDLIVKLLVGKWEFHVQTLIGNVGL